MYIHKSNNSECDIYIYIYIHTCIYRTNSELDIIKFGYQHLQLLNLS